MHDRGHASRASLLLRAGRKTPMITRFRTGLAAAALMAGTVAHAQTAERIWFGGPILTMNDKAMRAEAVAEAGGRIVAVGSRAEVMKTRGSNTQLIDLKGRTMLPGFIDSHGHVMLGGLQALSANLLAPPDGEVKDIAGLQATLRAWAKANAAAVKQANLIIGFGYDPSTLKEQRHPNRDELDAVSKDVPVVILHQSGHLSTLNSKALELAGVTAASKDPAGGVIRRRPGSQEPDGVLEENASSVALLKLVGGFGPEGLKSFARAGAQLWARYGYTTAQEGRAMPALVNVLKQVAAEGGIPVDIAIYPDVLVDRDFITANQSKTYSNHLRVAGGKLSLDGSPQGFTAWRDRPYYKPVGEYPAGYSGYPAATAEQAFDSVLWASRNKVQLLTHANGERASDLLIAAHQAAQALYPEAGKQRHVLIHGQFMRQDQMDSYKRLGVIPSLFPMHTFYWGDWHLDHTAGPVDGLNISPTGWALQRGMIFTSHHDAPVAFPNSMRVLDATVTRRARGSGRIVGPEQRVDAVTGLKTLTTWAAFQNGEEATKGSLEPGKIADLVILSADPTAVAPTSIADIKVVETVKEGKTIFRIAPADLKRPTAEAPDMAPLFAALAGKAGHAHGPGDDCPSEAMMRLTEVMLAAGGR
jgi:predicted amidohydrolase YtcJ